MHCEINAWQHYIDLLYLEAVRIKKFDPFVSALAIKPTLMTVPSLKEALRSRGLSTAGTKEILVKRLEGALAGEG